MNKITYSTLLMCATLAGSLTSCNSSNNTHNGLQSGTTNTTDIDPEFLILSDNQRKAIESGNEFALNLFKSQIGMDSKVVSPLSVAYVMNILENGAAGNTLTQMQAALHQQGLSLSDVGEAYKILLANSQRDKTVEINIANSIVVNKGVSLKNEFKKEASSVYDAMVSTLDFGSPSAVSTINKWCKKQTNGMIPTIVNALNANDMAVLLNAIYFNGTWANEFDKDQTKDERFQGYTRDVKRVKMMHQWDTFYYLKTDHYAAIQMPYSGHNYSMTVLLPEGGSSIDEMMKGLDAKTLTQISNKMERCKVDLKLPRFTIQTDVQLKKVLANLGAKDMFDTSANFSKMSDSGFFVSEVLHKAKIEVSEEGTKAAAVTAAIMTMSALNPDEKNVEFHANRPFVYMITDNNTGAIYFIGQYTGDDC